MKRARAVEELLEGGGGEEEEQGAERAANVLLELPPQVLAHVAGYLDVRSIMRMCSASRKFRAWCHQSEGPRGGGALWTMLYARNFAPPREPPLWLLLNTLNALYPVDGGYTQLHYVVMAVSLQRYKSAKADAFSQPPTNTLLTDAGSTYAVALMSDGLRFAYTFLLGPLGVDSADRELDAIERDLRPYDTYVGDRRQYRRDIGVAPDQRLIVMDARSTTAELALVSAYYVLLSRHRLIFRFRTYYSVFDDRLHREHAPSNARLRSSVNVAVCASCSVAPAEFSCSACSETQQASAPPSAFRVWCSPCGKRHLREAHTQ